MHIFLRLDYTSHLSLSESAIDFAAQVMRPPQRAGLLKSLTLDCWQDSSIFTSFWYCLSSEIQALCIDRFHIFQRDVYGGVKKHMSTFT